MRSERGASGLIAAALLATGLILALLIADVAQIVLARARLVTAADAAALAAAPTTFAQFGGGGNAMEEAAAMAAANGAEVVDCVCATDRSWSRRDVVVVVGMTVNLLVLGDRHLTATAAAEFRPISLADP